MEGQYADVMPREGVRTCDKKPIWFDRQDQGRQSRDEDKPAKEGRVAVEVSVTYAEKTSYLRTICAEIADSVKFVLLARSSTLCFHALCSASLPFLCHRLCQSYFLHPLILWPARVPTAWLYKLTSFARSTLTNHSSL